MKPVNGGRATNYGARLIAVMLLAGGLLGLLGSALPVYHSFQQYRVTAAISGILSTAWFAWCLPAGAALWRTTPTGFRWARLLFAMQVPVFSIARISYEFSTFFSLRFLIGNTTSHIGGNLGSSSNLHWLPQSVGFLFGINVVAVVVLLYLMRSSVPARRRPT